MKKQLLVTAIITIEGDNLTKNLIKLILVKIKQYFAYKYRSKDSRVEIVHFELSDNYVELQ